MYDEYDTLMDELDEIDDEIGVDEYGSEETRRIPYIGIIQSGTDVPTHIKRLAGANEYGFSTAHRNEEDEPYYEYASELKFMIVQSITTLHHRERVGGRKLVIPFNDEPGEESSIFPNSSQKGNGYGQACQSWNGIFPNPQFEGEPLRDPRTGMIHKIGWRGEEQLPVAMVCQSCPFKEWLDNRRRSLKGGNTPLCKPSWTWIIYVFANQTGTDKDGEECEIQAGLYRLTGNNTSVQTALYGVTALKRNGEPRWGALRNGDGIIGLNSLTAVIGTTIANIPYLQDLSKRQTAKWTGDIIDAKGVLATEAIADESPEDYFRQVSSPISKQFPQGKPELVGEVPVHPLMMVTMQNNNQLQGKDRPVSVPVTHIGNELLTGEEYMLFLHSWLEFVKVYKDDMLQLREGDYLAAQDQSAQWQIESGSTNKQLVDGVVDGV
ncbi:MAG: hypothetical protein KAS32_21295, partial [Candidatus Peribacteraceae bacterium]|nr:hypothetical protein [Candidatus Peribacteraceae bacterium]